MTDQKTMNDLISVMRALRDPDSGCPWDIEQNFQSIVPYTLEEAYEVADAIDRDNMTDLCEELGDLLLQSVYHAQMAKEFGHFDIHDVIHDITEKMISRHPHVFGDTPAENAEDVNAIWDARKQAEKNETKSALDGVTQALPALLLSQKLQKKAAKVGFEWPKVSHVLDKLEEEIAEMRAALDNQDKDNQAEELGDILFLLANYARMLDINAEEALRQCTQKFQRRFRAIEAVHDFQALSLDEWEAAWNAAKKSVG